MTQKPFTPTVSCPHCQGEYATRKTGRRYFIPHHRRYVRGQWEPACPGAGVQAEFSPEAGRFIAKPAE